VLHTIVRALYNLLPDKGLVGHLKSAVGKGLLRMFRVTDNQELCEIMRGEQSGTGAGVLTLVLFPPASSQPSNCITLIYQHRPGLVQ
jgi:hypothetical protein